MIVSVWLERGGASMLSLFKEKEKSYGVNFWKALSYIVQSFYHEPLALNKTLSQPS